MSFGTHAKAPKTATGQCLNHEYGIKGDMVHPAKTLLPMQLDRSSALKLLKATRQCNSSSHVGVLFEIAWSRVFSCQVCQ